MHPAPLLNVAAVEIAALPGGIFAREKPALCTIPISLPGGLPMTITTFPLLSLLPLLPLALDVIVDPVEIAMDELQRNLPVVALLIVVVVVITALLVRHFRKK